MATNSKDNSGAILNRRAWFDYHIGETLLCGIVLTGPEVRAARDHHVQLKGSFVTIRKGELWLNNASFSVKNNQAKTTEALTVVDTPRKLLATKKQISNFVKEKQAGYTIIPLKMLTNKNHIKVEIALAKGKKNYDKRQTIKTRDIERETNRRFM